MTTTQSTLKHPNCLILAASIHFNMHPFECKKAKGIGILLLFLLPQWLLGQKIEYAEQFLELLEQANLEVFEPFDAGYRSYQPLENELLNCHHAIRSNSEDLEIRYFVLPWNEADNTTTAPHVATFRVLTSIASNADEAVISAIPLDWALVSDKYNADWGMAYFFNPKPAFSDSYACKLMALSKEGQGTVFVFFLFDDPGNLALDLRDLSARFR